MKAAVLREIGQDLVIEDRAIPEPGSGEVLVRIAAAGVCHSDIHQQDGSVPPFRIPIVLGHENAGVVERLGTGAVGIDVGERVVVYGGWGCGRCRFCLGGEEQLCSTARWGGLGPDGGYAEYMIVPAARHLVPIGDLDFAQAAALADAGLTPYRAVKKALSRLAPGRTALVIGAGGLGQYGIQYLKLLTRARVVVVETSPERRELAVSLGADVVIDGALPDVADRVKCATADGGVTAAFDFVGIDSTLQLGVQSLERSGLLVIVGLAGGTVPLSFFGMSSEASVTTSNWGSRNDLEEVVALARSGALRATSERFPLSEINAVFEMLRAGRVAGRAVLVP